MDAALDRLHAEKLSSPGCPLAVAISIPGREAYTGLGSSDSFVMLGTEPYDVWYYALSGEEAEDPQKKFFGANDDCYWGPRHLIPIGIAREAVRRVARPGGTPKGVLEASITRRRFSAHWDAGRRPVKLEVDVRRESGAGTLPGALRHALRSTSERATQPRGRLHSGKRGSLMNKRARKHPVLGRLQWDSRVNSWESKVELAPGCSISFAIVAEADWAEKDPKELFAIGAQYLARARQGEPRVRERVADDLLDVYNESWADEDPNEGTPPMDRAEFLANIRPSGICLFHDGSSTWDYSCGDLFAGHGIWLRLGPDGKFRGEASLIG
jgi:hypothetical protein